MTVTHATSKSSEEILYATEWNEAHNVSGLATEIREGRPATEATTYFSLLGSAQSAVSTYSFIIGNLYHQPLRIPTSITIDRIGIEVTTLGVGLARLGIYTADNDWQPLALVLDAGTVDVSSTGVKTIAINQTLPAGKYLLVIVSNVTFGIRVFRGSILSWGLGVIVGLNSFISRLYRTFVYGVLPSPPSDWDTVGTGPFGFESMIFVRVSSP